MGKVKAGSLGGHLTAKPLPHRLNRLRYVVGAKHTKSRAKESGAGERMPRIWLRLCRVVGHATGFRGLLGWACGPRKFMKNRAAGSAATAL